MMKKAALLCALAVPAIASATEVGHWYLNPQIGGISVDNDRGLQDKDWLYGLGIGKHVNQGLSVELNLNGSKIDGAAGNGDLSLYGTSADLLGVLNRDGRFAPYLSVGAGVARNDRSPGDNAVDVMGQAGLGMFVRLWESADQTRTFSLRPDLKARWSESGATGTYLDYIGTLGFQLSFGAAPAPVAVLPPPAPAPVVEPAPLPPPPPADSDGDGVTDDKDKCPGTPAGVAVDVNGCPLKGSITLEGVNFELDSATLTAGSRNVLDSVAADLKKFPRLRIELQGHTDSSGSDRYNLNLSQQRAESVRTALQSQGVPTGQLVARGYGELQPTADNTTSEGRARNRRVVMLVLDNPGDVKVEGEGTAQK